MLNFKNLTEENYENYENYEDNGHNYTPENNEYVYFNDFKIENNIEKHDYIKNFLMKHFKYETEEIFYNTIKNILKKKETNNTK